MKGIMITKCSEQQQTVNDKKVMTLQTVLTTRAVIKITLNGGIMNYKNLYFY